MKWYSLCTSAHCPEKKFPNYFFKVLFILKAIEKMKKEHEQSTEKSKSGDKSLNTAEAEGKEVQEREPGTSHQLLLEYMHLDLSSLSSTVEFVVKFKQTGYPLHVLICNAGIAFANQGWFAHQVSNTICRRF